MKIYYIGGSPCSGKSTVAEMISKKHGLYYYKLDDMLYSHMKFASESNKPGCNGYLTMTPEQIWMRSAIKQFEHEVNIYKEIFEYALEDISRLFEPAVIAEGAGFLPELMKHVGVRESEYVCITPTYDFQVEKYSSRDWVPSILEGCSDKQVAFLNWMNRDEMFGEYVAETAKEFGYKSFLVDGGCSPSDIVKMVERVFKL